MAHDVDLYLPGFLKPLSQWSERALDQLIVDLGKQARVETGPAAQEVLQRCYDVLKAEARRRAGTLSPEHAERMRAAGHCAPFNARKAERTGGEGRGRPAAAEKTPERTHERAPEQGRER